MTPRELAAEKLQPHIRDSGLVPEGVAFVAVLADESGFSIISNCTEKMRLLQDALDSLKAKS